MKTKNHTSYCRGTWHDRKGNTEKYVNKIPGNLSLAEIQKIVLNSSAPYS